MDEVNLNFRTKQMTGYLNGVLMARIEGEDFVQFEDLQLRLEKACEKSPEQIEKEKQEIITQLGIEIAEKQAKIAELQDSLEKGLSQS